MRMSRDSLPTQARRATARALALLASVCALSACVYRMPIQQGNYLDPVVIAQVKPGMTHSQVRYLLGTPMVPGAFDNSRWTTTTISDPSLARARPGPRGNLFHQQPGRPGRQRRQECAVCPDQRPRSDRARGVARCSRTLI